MWNIGSAVKLKVLLGEDFGGGDWDGGAFSELGLEEEGSASLAQRLGAVTSFALNSLSGLVVIAGVEETSLVGGDILGEGEGKERPRDEQV